MASDINPGSIEPGDSTRHFSVKITAESGYYPWERIASPLYPRGDFRPYLTIEYTSLGSQPQPDFTLFASSIETDPTWPVSDQEVELKALIRNTGPGNAYKICVLFYDDDPASGGLYLGQDTIFMPSGIGNEETASIPWEAKEGRHKIHVVIDPFNSADELDEDNNLAFNTITVLKGYKMYSETFEFGFGDWVYDFEMPMEYATERFRENYMHPTRDEVYKGNQSVFAYLDGQSDDGTIWLERSITVPRNTYFNVKFSFALGVEADLATTVMGFIGTYNPEIELDFEEKGMENGWHVYTFEGAVDTINTNQIWFGGGFTARWETELEKYLDNFKITITEVPH